MLNRNVGELVFGVVELDLDFWVSKLILSNNQSRATLWVLETCLMVELLTLIIILIAASLSSKIKREKLAFDVTQSTFVQPRSPDVLDCFFVLSLECFSQCLSRKKLARALGCFEEEFNSSITKSQRSRAGILSLRRPASKEKTSDSVEPCETQV